MTLIEQLRREEGVKSSAYQDHLGFWTIGVGRLIDARKGGGLSDDEIDYLLANDIQRFTAGVRSKLPWFDDLNEPRQAVLVGMAFQMGLDGLLAFGTTLSHVRTGRWTEAAQAMMASRWAAQTPSRAKRLAEQMRTGTWQ